MKWDYSGSNDQPASERTKRHLNGVLLAGQWWPTEKRNLDSLSPLINWKKLPELEPFDPLTGCAHGGGTHNIFRRRLVCHMICLQTMKPNFSICIKREHLLSIYLQPNTRIWYHEISNLAQKRAKKAEMSLCTCGISIEPSHQMNVDESSEFWHLDKLNIVDGSSLRWWWSYTINSYGFNPNCYDLKSNYWLFEEKIPHAQIMLFSEGSNSDNFVFIVDEERERGSKYHKKCVIIGPPMKGH